MDAPSFTLRFADDPDKRLEAAEFVDRIYLAEFGTVPPIASVYSVIMSGTEMIACIGIDLPDEEGLLPIERAYGLDEKRYPLHVERRNKLQFGRWVSIDPRAGPLAVYGAACYGISRERIYGIVEHDAIVHRRSKLYGLKFWDIPGASLNILAIREENRAFYSRGTMRPYLMDLLQMREALQGRAARLHLVSLP